jgi:hypothetical protein
MVQDENFSVPLDYGQHRRRIGAGLLRAVEARGARRWMRANLDVTRGLIVSEAVMMGLAPKMGRDKAHDVLYATFVRHLAPTVALTVAARGAFKARSIGSHVGAALKTVDSRQRCYRMELFQNASEASWPLKANVRSRVEPAHAAIATGGRTS